LIVMRYNSEVTRTAANPDQDDKRPVPVAGIVRELALFRYSLRKFLRFSERAARQFGVTPQQHQLMLGVAGFTGRGTASISELAEFLQERHHSVVELTERAVQNGLVCRNQDSVDRRVVVVSLTPKGEEILVKLSTLHREEIERVRAGFLDIPRLSTPGTKKKKMPER
jgi:DNA-binding MarR family transcriptional regulator